MLTLWTAGEVIWRPCEKFADVCSPGKSAWHQIEPDWPQMGQIWDFLRSVSVHFGAPRQNVLKLILTSPRFVPFGANLTPLVSSHIKD